MATICFWIESFELQTKKVKHGTSWALQTVLLLWSDEVFQPRSQWLQIQNTLGCWAKRFSRSVSNNIKTISRLDFLSGTHWRMRIWVVWETEGWRFLLLTERHCSEIWVNLEIVHKQQKVSKGPQKNNATKSQGCVHNPSTTPAKAMLVTVWRYMSSHLLSFFETLKVISSRSASHPPPWFTSSSAGTFSSSPHFDMFKQNQPFHPLFVICEASKNLLLNFNVDTKTCNCFGFWETKCILSLAKS